MSNLELIQKLRQQTGSGMLDCKKALEDSDGNFDQAVDLLRKKGMAKAAKRQDRETSEGVIKIETSEDGKVGYMVEVNCETDFVARNDQFGEFADKIFQLVKENEIGELDDLLKSELDGKTVEENITELSGSIGEKLAIGSVAVLKSDGTVAGYSHMGGKIGVLLAVNKEGQEDLVHDIAMQVAAMNPEYLAPQDVPAETAEKEKTIYTEQLKKEGKPEEIIDKILEGKINKFYKEICLTKQAYIKDDSKTIEKHLTEVAGEDAKIEAFIRFSLQ